MFDQPTHDPSTPPAETPSESAAPGTTGADGAARFGGGLRSRLRPQFGRGAAIGLASFLAVILLAVTFTAGAGAERAGLLGGQTDQTAGSAGGDQLALIEEAWGLLHTKFVGARNLDSTTMAYAAIRAMTDSVGDTGHTFFMTPAEAEAATRSLSGSYGGIGAEMELTGGQTVVVTVFHGTPADAAGLRAGDVITSVDGTPTEGLALTAVIGKIRGPAGTTVTLTVERPGTVGELTFKIVRANVKLPTVEWVIVPGTSVGMIRIEHFTGGSGDEFKKDLAEMLAAGAKSVVLDLRGNPGGYLTDAIAVASQFLASGTVYIERDATGKETPTEVVSGGIATKLPLVVLIDARSASSSEIVTGALQDPGRATVIGVKTYGTGTVTLQFGLADGSALRIGTVEWLTPKGREIWHNGLLPDITVELPSTVSRVDPPDLSKMTPAEVRSTPDVQLRRALEVLKALPAS